MIRYGEPIGPPAVTAHHREGDSAMPRPRVTSEIIHYANGDVGARVDVAPRGRRKRQQQTVRASNLTELGREVDRIRAGRNADELVARGRHTVADIVASFTAVKARDFDPTSTLALANEFRPLLSRLGDELARQVERDDIEALVTWCLAEGAAVKHDAAWERRAALANAALRAGPGGAKVAALAAGLDEPARAYQDLRALEQLGLVRRLPGKGWWAAATGQPVTAAGLAPAAGRLAPVTVANMLLSWHNAFARAVVDRKIAWNPCEGVHVKVPKTPPRCWDRDQLAAFAEAITGHRHEAILWLFLLGLRRGEGAGLMWDDFGPAAPPGTVTISRELVRDRSAPAGWRVKPPKSELSHRPLPLPGRVAALLAARRKAEAAERLAAGPAWAGTGFVGTDEIGRPYYPEWWSIEFAAIARAAGLPKLKLHGTRHTAATLMAVEGVSVEVAAAWLGHTPRVHEQTYRHGRPADLAPAADVMTRILGG